MENFPKFPLPKWERTFGFFKILPTILRINTRRLPANEMSSWKQEHVPAAKRYAKTFLFLSLCPPLVILRLTFSTPFSTSPLCPLPLSCSRFGYLLHSHQVYLVSWASAKRQNVYGYATSKWDRITLILVYCLSFPHCWTAPLATSFIYAEGVFYQRTIVSCAKNSSLLISLQKLTRTPLLSHI